MMADGLIVNGIETLFITGHNVQEQVSNLQKLADEGHFACTVFGCVA